MESNTKYYVYILKCADNTYYIGKTNNLQKRLKQHNGELSNGAKYTRTRRPVILAYIEEYPDTSTALKREYILKQKSRSQKEILIKTYDT